MLVLSRKKNERIIIEVGGKKVEIVIVELGPDKVRLGFEADKEIPIHRQEVYNAIKRQEDAKKDTGGTGLD